MQGILIHIDGPGALGKAKTRKLQTDADLDRGDVVVGAVPADGEVWRVTLTAQIAKPMKGGGEYQLKNAKAWSKDAGSASRKSWSLPVGIPAR